MARVKLRGFKAIDRQTAATRETLAFRCELIPALGGDQQLAPPRLRLVYLAARAAWRGSRWWRGHGRRRGG